MRILLVEDDLPLASALAEFLGAKGFVCECAASHRRVKAEACAANTERNHALCLMASSQP